MQPQFTTKDITRFWSKVDKSGSIPVPCPELGPCWVWTGWTHKGYGRFSKMVKRSVARYRAHRLAYLFAFGVFPEELDVCHKCDNPPCCNPTHLFLGTHLDNMRDEVLKGRTPKGLRSGRYTHPESTSRGERHCCAKLTEAQVIAIRTRWAAGEWQSALAREHGVSSTVIWNLVHRYHWAHIP